MSSRPKRANAGSKMGELIAEQIKAGLITVGTEEVHDQQQQQSQPKVDKDFTAVQQEDVFDSDFESTDEEDEDEGAQAMAKSSTASKNLDLDDEAAEKAAKKKRLDALLVKPMVKKPVKPRQPKGIYCLLNEVQRDLAPVRQSGRSSTQESRRHLMDTLYEHDLRRRENARPKKRKKKTMTQEERLEEAKLTEVQNLASLDLYKQIEDENRLRARATKKRKYTLTGPIIRYHSFYYGEGDEDYHVPVVKEIQPDTPAKPLQAKNDALPISIPGQPNIVNSAPFPRQQLPVNPTLPQTNTPPAATDSEPVVAPALVKRIPNMNDQPLPFQRTHLSFIDYKVPEKFCPITGEIAKFRCPKTLVPYANMNAYKTIQKIQNGEWMWSSVLGAFGHRRDVKVPGLLAKDWALNFGIVRTEPQLLSGAPMRPPSGFIPLRPPIGSKPFRPPYPPGLVRPYMRPSARPGKNPIMHVLPRPGMLFRPPEMPVSSEEDRPSNSSEKEKE